MSTEAGVVVFTVVHSWLHIRVYIHNISNMEKEFGTVTCFHIMGWLVLVGNTDIVSIFHQPNTWAISMISYSEDVDIKMVDSSHRCNEETCNRWE